MVSAPVLLFNENVPDVTERHHHKSCLHFYVWQHMENNWKKQQQQVPLLDWRKLTVNTNKGNSYTRIRIQHKCIPTIRPMEENANYKVNIKTMKTIGPLNTYSPVGVISCTSVHTSKSNFRIPSSSLKRNEIRQENGLNPGATYPDWI